MHSVCVDLQVCVGGHAHQLVEVHVQLQLGLLLVFALVSLLNGFDSMRVHNDMNPLHMIKNTSHHVCSAPTTGIDL